MGKNRQGFIHSAEFSSTTHQVSWPQIPAVPLLCPGVPGTYHPAQEAPAQWAGAQISRIFRYFEIVFTDRSEPEGTGDLSKALLGHCQSSWEDQHQQVWIHSPEQHLARGLGTIKICP